MTQNKKLGLTVLLLCGVIAAAYFGYKTLSANYLTDNLRPASSASSGEQSGEGSAAEKPERTVAPNFTMTDLEGNKVELDSFKGKPIVLNFWASWCGFCVQEMPDFDTVYKELGDEVTFVMLNVTDGVRETREKGEKYYAEKGYSFPVYFDDQGTQGTNAYGVTGFPSTYFIDSNGNLAAYAGGMIDQEALRRGIKLAQEQDAGQALEQKNVSWCTMEPVYNKMNAENAKQMMAEFDETEDSTYVLLDVRTEQEFKEKRIPGSVLIPDYELAQRAEAELPDKRQVIFVYCRSGRRSEAAAKELVAMGYNHVYDVGGIIDWPYETTQG
ncbi:MAG: TlpA family protein disulfide reductase [Oscillospiraceae bacterium]|jgi:rhodanese-related sulfurtransferase/peroxiredoxin|nr:TlpA family protein disulfide reductase [Oscillospiraceae bacterium]